VIDNDATSNPIGSAPASPARQDLFRQIVENSVDLIVCGDAARNRTYVSPSSKELLGFEPAELMGKHGFELVHPEDLPEVRKVFERIGPLFPSQTLTFRMRRKDGDYIWIGGRYRHLPADGGVVAILRDITGQMTVELELKRANARLAEANAMLAKANASLRELAHVDGLTGLSNRRYFDVTLKREFRRARREEISLGLLLLDIDNFKAFNDLYGHLGGDDCLRRVGQCIKGSIRRPGDSVARYGGEEIAVLLPATDMDGAVTVAEQIRGDVEHLRITHAGSERGFVTVSAGASTTLPARSAIEPSALIKAADVALYQAKAAGRNRVGYCAVTSPPTAAEGAEIAWASEVDDN
jgi:diguanylate cyclase (GGDEF)-like protein/PAS domain S-box-containing protein